MRHVGVVGLSWRAGGPELLAQFTRPPEERAEVVRGLCATLEADELFYLATCNRVEVGFVTSRDLRDAREVVFRELSGRAPEGSEGARALKVWAGEGAVEHMFLVGAGLDSAKVGETEIAGQLRDALKVAREAGSLGSWLGPLLEEALKVAGRVHRLTGVNSGHVSLAEIAIERVLAHVRGGSGVCALIGVSDMTERCARALGEQGAPFVVVNRTLARAERLAAEAGGRAMTLEAFRAAPPGVRALVSATGAVGPVLSREVLGRVVAASDGEVLAVDMAVDPDVGVEDAASVGVRRVGLAEVLKEAEVNRARRLEEMADARVLVDEALDRFRLRISKSLLGPAVAALQRTYLETAEEGLEALLKRGAVKVDEGGREALRKWLETLARRFAHVPTEGLKGVTAEFGVRGAKAFLERADPRLLAELGDGAVELRAFP